LSDEDKALSLSVIFGLRLAYAHFGRGIPYRTFCALFAGSESRFNVAAVLEAIREAVAASGLYIIVHIDEVKRYLRRSSCLHILHRRAFSRSLCKRFFILMMGGN
jgi:hypothetical protein